MEDQSISSNRCVSCCADLAGEVSRCRNCGAWTAGSPYGSLLSPEDIAEVERGIATTTSAGGVIVTATDSGSEPTLIVPIQSDKDVTDRGPRPRYRQKFSPDETQPISRIRAQQAAEARRSRLAPLGIGFFVGIAIAAVASIVALQLSRTTTAARQLPPPRSSPPPAYVIAPPSPVDIAPAVQPPPAITELKTEIAPPTRTVRPRRVSVPLARPSESIAPAAPTAQPVRAGDLVSLDDAGVTPPALIADVPPQLPLRAWLTGATGSVELSLLIDHNGRIEDVRIAQSSGNSLLDQSAAAAARSSRFLPAKKDGVPVRIWIVRYYNFR